MSQPLQVDQQTLRNQHRASNPANSAWVSANAGSGKTYVLAQRVVRLLLAGADPSRILCLTYTKAAAGEMSNRVFEILGDWVARSDEELRQEIERIEQAPARPDQMARARILFARALETPGGLKIQTIHAFCEALLHQFPLEANVPGAFTVMDDLQQRQLMAQARRLVALQAHDDPDGRAGGAFLRVVEQASDYQIDRALDEVINNRDTLAEWLIKVEGPEGATRHVRQTLSFNPDDSVESLTEVALAESLFRRLDCRAIADFARETGASQSVKLANHLEKLLDAKSIKDEAAAIDEILLTKSGTPRSFNRYPSKAIHDVFPDLRADLQGECDRWLSARSRIKTLQLIEKTQPLLIVAEAMIGHYVREKRKRGLLDFDDLIDRTAELLSRSDARSWVLYKLDLGIDHILLDEAQDTSPKQWQIISALVEEFFSGQSARLTERTVFAVGDEKQSIYSFRGAEPKNFARQRHHYLKQARSIEKSLEDVALNLSFRSTQDVLGAVDAVFAIDEHAQGITFGEKPPAHVAARYNQPGSVDVWDLIEAKEGDEPENWHMPVDYTGQHQALLLADKVAKQIAAWIGSERIEATGQVIRAEDILILVRSRDRFVGALNRALKARGIPVSGADRLKITDHIAVQDLIAAGQVVLTPDDDLSLAVVLKCPLIGISEEDLFDLSQSRFKSGHEISLFAALREAKQPQFVNALNEIQTWRKLSDQIPVFEFYARILETRGGRKKFLSRLGSEAEDVIDAFLDTALAHEQGNLPGLQAFLNDLLEEQPEIKREMDSSAGEIRIMTVHAAKGLEAPIVFLVDKCRPAFQPQHAPALYSWSDPDKDPCYLWVASSGDHSNITNSLRDEEKRRAEEEYRRLLYVGMTRAKDRLIICGYRGSKTPTSPNWHAMVTKALEPNWQDVEDGDGKLLWHRWKASESPNASSGPAVPAEETSAPGIAALPGWISTRLPPETKLPRPLNPSGAQAVIDESLARQAGLSSPFKRQDAKPDDPDRPDPRRRGTILHRLLQVLPESDTADKWALAETYLAQQLPQYSHQTRQHMLAAIKNLFNSPALEGCFDPQNSRAEVPLLGTIESRDGPRTVSGEIDRLAVRSDEVVVLDYKTSTNVPDSVEGISEDYITQLALYRALVARLYPEKPVRCLLVWTHAADGPVVMQLENSALDAAYEQIAQL